ncbi:hypothetical protein ACFYT4_02445 [Streptomyces sp. NPDC004609]|uniref:hypothetical protein n=1 Tax=Streptomyces sp. NPDC004609 TaxID=3364704 RepID=UPI0036BFE602
MGLNELLAAIGQLNQLVREQGIVSGSIPHTLLQLEDFIRATIAGQEVQLEQRVRLTISETNANLAGQLQESVRELSRTVDVANHTLAANTEEKTTVFSNKILNEEQITRDVLINALGRITTLRTENVALTPDVVKGVQTQLEGLFQRMAREGFQPSMLKEGFERLHFVDAMQQAFQPAIEVLFAPDGPMAKITLRAVSSSPDFRPAMDVLFGPSGKMADTAHDAALGVNLGPAEKTFGKKLEDGVGAALDQAGDKAAAKATESLGQKISSGATALGTAMTSIPQLYDSVTKLGEAWDKPNKSTKDYMDLLGAAGGAVGQAGQVLQALSGVTQIATAAQAVFNAVMAMNPIVLVVIAVVALIAAIVLLIVYWDQVSAALRDNPWLAVVAVMLGVIGIIIVIIAYWDEIKLAVLIAANFISIQVQTIGQMFAGLGALVGQVWAWIVATAQNAGIGVINTFIAAGTAVQNFFVGLINGVLGMYNQLADSAAGQLAGLTRANLIPQAEVQARLIPPKDVPPINVTATLTPKPVKGGLEGQIAAQEEAVAKARQADEERRAKAAAPAPAPAAGPPPAGGPHAPAATPAAGPAGGLPGAPLPGALPGAVPAGPPALPAAGPPGAAAPGGPGAAGARPVLPPAMAAPAAAAAAPDQSVHVEGGITVNINAERLEADAARLLSDEIIQRIQERLGALRSEQDFRTGTRAPAPA